MPKWMTFAFALFLSMQVFSTEGKDVDHAINNYIKAMGGMERMHSAQVYIEGLVNATDEGRATSIIAVISKNLLNVDPNGQTSIFNAPSGSNKNRLKLERLTANMFKFSLNLKDCSLPMVDYVGKGMQAEFVGRENIHGRPAIKLKLSLNSTQYIYYYLDPTSWYILSEERFMTTGKQQVFDSVEQLDYLHYNKCKQGLVFPSAVVWNHSDTILNKLTIQLDK